MTAPTLAVFITCFVAAPLLFALLLQFGQSLRVLLSLALSVVVCVVAALLMQAQDRMLSALALLGLSWVLAIAMVAVTLLRRLSGARPRRWIVLIGILATTLPWFGLATARSLIP
ncbi:hypothetical protein AL036_12735 [Salipiger aestuarii]|uniref:Uncharacterized protein n=1 Tax=Salipiger aestuarii TaxID=568098 RepID=A0A327Y1P4_9RHOB|nr:hypothetical protein [Salipiger aestuarii]EIE50220.1 hypothetical protein C357_14771 [Citreicella sp. 357]KAA8606933.1 hypothetical protein AL036_12735 [Salipiger aestuarii]KAA8610784.1 hypothetical protein AL037_11930 [Salipiger aestuarii]KAB2541568.1 hypothetical protein AL035_11495 [Salipiger aestuarii]RAK14242.1 hypothetical protein ATI53_102843 [Salipiger aestuarii]